MTSTILASFSSPDRGVWHIGIIPIRAYALCIIAGIVAALVIGDRRWVARGGQRGVIYDIALWAVPFGLIGGRLYHVMTDWPTYFGPSGYGFVAALRIWDGGLGIWGAVALGGVGAWIGCRTRGIPLPAFGDAIAPGIILAQAIGRLGNYFNQELYGGPTDLPWGLLIYERVLPDGKEDRLNGVSTGQLLDSAPVPVHPTFLYELLWNLLVFAVLLWADRRFRLGHGRLFALYVAGYCLGRFWIELLRHDHASLIAGIRVNTFTSAFVFLGAVIYIVVAAKGREAPETLWGKTPGGEDAPPPEVPVTAGVASGAASVAAAKDIETPAPDVEPAPQDPEPESVNEAGLGSVESDEVTAAEGDAAEVHDAAVEQADEAEATADDVADEPESDAEPPAADGDEATSEDDTAEVHDAAVEPAGEAEVAEDVGAEPKPDAESESVNEAGLGSVQSDEVTAAEGDAAEVHDAAVEQADEAQATADDVAAEPESDSQPAAEDAESESVNEAGLGSVQSDEVTAAEGDAAEVHDAAVEEADEAQATADDVAAEPESDSQPAAEDAESESVNEAGLGSVEAEEVSAAEGDAAEVHDAAVEQAGEAEATADDVAAEPESDAQSAAEDAESESVNEAGLGSVEAEEVSAAEGDAAEVHDAAVEQASEAEATADDVAAEPESDAQPAAEDAESDSVNEAGLGSVEAEEVSAAEGDAAEVHDAAVQQADEAEKTATAPPRTPPRRRWRRRG